MLDGQGADELLAGYNGFPESVFKSLFDQRRFAEIFRFMNRWSDSARAWFLKRDFETCKNVSAEIITPTSTKSSWETSTKILV